MAAALYVVNTTVTVAAGTPATLVAGEPGTGGASGYGNTGTSAGSDYAPRTFHRGQLIYVDPASALGTALGANITGPVTRSREGGTSGGFEGTSN